MTALYNQNGQLPYYCLDFEQMLPSNKRRPRITKNLMNAAALNRIITVLP